MAKDEPVDYYGPTVPLDVLDADLCSRLPHPVKVRLLSFLTLGLHGNFELNVVGGEVQGYNVHEFNRCNTGAASRNKRRASD